MIDPLPGLPPGPLPLGNGDVEIVAALGRVGDGFVYAAREGSRAVRLREYAPAGIVQRLPDGTLHAADPRFAAAWDDALGRFVDKGRRLAEIDHYAVARVRRAVPVEGDGVRQGAFTVGDPVGEPLADALAGGLQLAPAEILRVAAELADALADLHARGVTHLDISPATVSLSAGWLELTDFAIDNRPFMALLGSQRGLVRPGYSPIEHHHATMADPLGPPADIYAASALLFRLVTGRDPAPWQERWRNPEASMLDGANIYPPGFLAAIERGLAIEPADRFPDGAAWREALALPPVHKALQTSGSRHSAPVAAAPAPPPPAPVTPPAVPARSWVLPLLLALGILAIAVGGYLAYTQRWFVPAPDQPLPENGAVTRTPDPAPPPPRVTVPPRIGPGTAVSGRLSTSDDRRGGGQFEDRFTIEAQGGERLDIRVASSEFDPLLTVSGPGLQAANDDESAATRNSRLLVTLPRAGRYTVSVSSYDRGETGAYLLEVGRAAAEPVIPEPADDVVEDEEAVKTLDLSLASRLSGRWRAPADVDCEVPAINSVSGDELISRISGDVYRHRIVATEGDVVRTVVTGGRLAGRGFQFRIGPDGRSYSIAGETWVRC